MIITIWSNTIFFITIFIDVIFLLSRSAWTASRPKWSRFMSRELPALAKNLSWATLDPFSGSSSSKSSFLQLKTSGNSKEMIHKSSLCFVHSSKYCTGILFTYPITIMSNNTSTSNFSFENHTIPSVQSFGFQVLISCHVYICLIHDIFSLEIASRAWVAFPTLTFTSTLRKKVAIRTMRSPSPSKNSSVWSARSTPSSEIRKGASCSVERWYGNLSNFCGIGKLCSDKS